VIVAGIEITAGTEAEAVAEAAATVLVEDIFLFNKILVWGLAKN
jgi:hypothetical protein